METIKKKIIVAFLFAFFATLVSVLMKYNNDLITQTLANMSKVGINFTLFFLIGYVVLGNILVTKKNN